MARLDARWNALFEFIYRTPAAGLDGVALKLRMLTDRHVRIDDLGNAEAAALSDMARVIERTIRNDRREGLRCLRSII